METKIYQNYEDFLSREDKKTNGVTLAFLEENKINLKELKDKHCKACNNKTDLKNNKHLYFKLSSFQKVLEKLVLENEHNWRKNAVNETKKYLTFLNIVFTFI